MTTTIMKLDAQLGKPGAYGGSVNLQMFLKDIVLRHSYPGQPDSVYILSLRDDFVSSRSPEQVGGTASPYQTYELGNACGTLRFESIGKQGVWRMAVESPNAADFVALTNELYKRLGAVHIQLPTPRPTMPEISFIAGLRTDMRNLGTYVKRRWEILWQRMRRQVAN